MSTTLAATKVFGDINASALPMLLCCSAGILTSVTISATGPYALALLRALRKTRQKTNQLHEEHQRQIGESSRIETDQNHLYDKLTALQERWLCFNDPRTRISEDPETYLDYLSWCMDDGDTQLDALTAQRNELEGRLGTLNGKLPGIANECQDMMIRAQLRAGIETRIGNIKALLTANATIAEAVRQCQAQSQANKQQFTLLHLQYRNLIGEINRAREEARQFDLDLRKSEEQLAEILANLVEKRQNLADIAALSLAILEIAQLEMKGYS